MNKEQLSISDLISVVKGLWGTFRAHLKLLILVSFLAGILGFTIAYFKKVDYSGHVSFMLAESETPQFNLSSIAGLAGFGMGNLGGGVNEDKLMFLANSRLILGSTLLNKVRVDNKQELLVNYLIRIYEPSVLFKKDTLLDGFESVKNGSLDSLTIQENKAIDLIIKMFSDKKMLKIEGKKKSGIVMQNAGIITIDFTSADERFSKLFLDCLFDNINKYYVNKTIQRQQRNFTLIKHRADSLQSILMEKETSGASMIDMNINLARLKGRVEIERTKRDIELLSLMYAEVLKNLEIAKFNLENQTPLLVLIDKPSYPLEIKKQSKVVFALVFALFAGIITLITLYVISITSKSQHTISKQ